MPSTSQLTSNSRSMNGLNTINANAVFTDTLEVNTLTIDTAGTVPTRPNGDNTANIANTQFVTNAVSTAGANLVTLTGASQIISSEKTFSNENTFITGNTVTDSIQSSAVNSTQNIATTQTTGVLNIATGATKTGAINIGTGASGKTITIGNNAGGNTSFNGTNVLIRPASLVGIGDSMSGGSINIGRNDTGTSSTAVNINNGTNHTGVVNIGTGSAKTITIGSTAGGTTTLNSGTLSLDTTTSGTINVGATQTGGTINLGVNSLRTGAININTGLSSTASVNISSGASGNAPITIGSSASSSQTCAMNGITTFQKIVSCAIAPTLGSHLCNKTYVDSVASGATLAGTNVWTGTNTFDVNLPTSTLTATTSTQFMTKGAVDASFVNLAGTQIVSGAKEFSGNTTCSGRLFMIQNNINTLTNTQLGYTALQTLSEFTFTADTWGNVGSIPIPTNGIWITSVSLTTRTTGGAGTVNSRNFVVSSVPYPTTGYDTAIGTLEYYEEDDDSVGANGKRFSIGISGVLGANGSTTYYINGRFSITGVTVYGIAKTAITKVG